MLTGKAMMSQEAINAWFGHSLTSLVAFKAKLLHINETDTWLHLLKKNASNATPAPAPSPPPMPPLPICLPQVATAGGQPLTTGGMCTAEAQPKLPSKFKHAYIVQMLLIRPLVVALITRDFDDGWPRSAPPAEGGHPSMNSSA